VFHRGRVEQLDTPERMYEHPRNAFVARFIGENNRLAGRLESVADGRCTVQLATGDTRIDGTLVEPVSPGGAVCVSLRPERVQIRAAGHTIDARPGCCLAGSLREIVYLGDHVRARVAINGTEEFMVKRPISSAERISRECLGMPLRMLQRAVSAVYDDALGGHGVGIAQLNLLVAVERLGDRATPSQLSRVMMLEKSSVSRDVDRLVERGWVTRSIHADGRSQRLALTVQGRRLIDAALPSWEAAQARVRALLGDEGADLLVSMVERLRAAEPPPVSGRAPSDR